MRYTRRLRRMRNMSIRASIVFQQITLPKGDRFSRFPRSQNP